MKNYELQREDSRFPRFSKSARFLLKTAYETSHEQ